MAFNKFRRNWTGPSGAFIGYATDYPTDTYSAFTSDPIHGQALDPNNPNGYMQPGVLTESPPVNIQDEFSVEDDGSYGWILDNLDFPEQDDKPGTRDTYTDTIGPARRRIPDVNHGRSIYQKFFPAGWGRNFWGPKLDMMDLPARASSNTPPPNRGAYPMQAREDTSNWPVPFDSVDVAPLLPVARDTEKIVMRRMTQDNPPLYRQLAVPARNTVPSGSVYTPTYASNEWLQNQTAKPAAARTPVDPWASQEYLAAQAFNEDPGESIIGDGWQ